jgi:hypothetical protein
VNARFEHDYPHGIMTSLLLEIWLLVKRLVMWW